VTKKNDTWMPLYIGDYLADTSRLSTIQHGAYLLLLMDYWRNGPPLDDDDELASITKLPLSEWKKHATKIRQFFDSIDGRLVQKRADAERDRAGLVSKKRSESGKAGAAKRWAKDGKRDGEAMANGMANAIANPPPERWQNDAPSQSQSEGKVEVLPPTLRAGGRETETEGHAPTPAGLVCRALRQAGVADTNPGHPRLLALLAAGAVEAEFVGFVPAAQAKGAGFLWILGAVEGERKRAQQNAGQLHQGRMPEAPKPREATNGAPDPVQTQRLLQAQRDVKASPEAVQAGLAALKAIRGAA
jgi:uncharacterized protein YdaU (DUF1376 family)